MSLFLSSVFTYDEDAGNYIQAVEGPSGDNQALEPATRKAINNFVIGCKQDGIWTAIKASCILSGARTLAGALQPLVGTAPTNNGPFVSGDYVRKTGLVGNGSSKYLNSNRSATADPQNNAHLAVYQSTAASSSSNVFMSHIAAVDASSYGSQIAEGFPSSVDQKFFRLRSDNALSPGTIKTSTNNANGLQGVSRISSASLTFRAGVTDTLITNTSVAQASGNYFVLAQNNAGTVVNHSNARLAFYSIGESLDLARLDARVTDLINAFAVTIP